MFSDYHSGSASPAYYLDTVSDTAVGSTDHRHQMSSQNGVVIRSMEMVRAKNPLSFTDNRKI